MKPLVAGAMLVVAWPLVLSRFGSGDVYLPLGAFAVFVIGVVLALGRDGDAAALAPRTPPRWTRGIVVGLACGAVMTVGTYAAYAVVVRLAPSVAGSVAGLYANAGTSSLALALIATSAAVVAEEVLWRGPLLRVLERRTGRAAAVGISLITYTLAQGGSRSVIVMVAAVVCGAIWSTERIYTRSVVAPLVSHLMWTLIVIHLLPVTRL
jgi:hypothetical protein